MSITRTTVSLDSGLLATAKHVADQQKRTLSQLVTEALQSLLAKSASVQPQKVVLPTSGHGGLRPGVNLNSNTELASLLDEGDAQWSSRM